MQIAGRVQCIEWTHSYLIEGNLRSQQYWYFLFFLFSVTNLSITFICVSVRVYSFVSTAL